MQSYWLLKQVVRSVTTGIYEKHNPDDESTERLIHTFIQLHF
jgi:hypothetical protein